jgi:hypothetical protein
VDIVKKMPWAGFLLTLGACLLGVMTHAGQTPASQTPDQPAHAIYNALNALRVNAQEVYTVRDLDFRYDAVHLTFIQGQLAFLESFQGKVTGAVFTGRGHILVAPRDPTEKTSVARFLGAPILDQRFSRVYMRFDGAAAGDLLARLQQAGVRPAPDADVAEDWNATIGSLNPWQSLRILTDVLSTHPMPYFYAGVLGDTSGAFDVLVDDRRPEQVMLGQPKVVNGQTFYDTWASFFRMGATEAPPAFSAETYFLDTTVQPDLDLAGTANLVLHSLQGGERVVPLELSNLLRVESVQDESGHPLEFFQSEAAVRHEITSRGDDSVVVVLPQPAQAGQTFHLRLAYRGRVISAAGNGAYFVGEHGSWYPHITGPDSFANFDLNFRWPHQLQLVATGQKLDEHEDGDWRVAHWHSEKPIFVAGFNLGAYRVVNMESAGIKVDLYANAQLNQSLQPKSSQPVLLSPIPKIGPSGNVKPSYEGSVMLVNPAGGAPIDLRALGDEISQAMQFFSRFGGPFPYSHLEVSQIPGDFGQGWPGLLYIPTFSFLSPEAQSHVGLNVAKQEHFSQIVQYHEVAHQWWGNLVVWHSYRDQWICEGLANYIALMFADSRKDSAHPLSVWLGRYRESLTARLPGSKTDDLVDSTGPLALGFRLNSSVNPTGYQEIIYPKATWVFHMLRMMMREPLAKDPDGRFTALLRSLAASHKDAALTTDDFQRAVEKAMLPSMDLEGGHSMSWFFDQWVRGTGIPRYKVDFTVSHSADQFVVKGVLHQSGVPADFLAAVPLFVSYAGGKPVPLGRVVTTGEETSFRFVTHVDPKKILIDPEMTLLCRID